MPKGVRGFQKGTDPNRNMRGRTPIREKIERTKQEVGKAEMEQILRRLKPLSRIALTKLGVMLDDATTSENARLKVAIYLLDKYKDVLQELYIDSEDDENANLEPADVKPLFSLVMKEEDR